MFAGLRECLLHAARIACVGGLHGDGDHRAKRCCRREALRVYATLRAGLRHRGLNRSRCEGLCRWGPARRSRRHGLDRIQRGRRSRSGVPMPAVVSSYRKDHSALAQHRYAAVPTHITIISARLIIRYASMRSAGSRSPYHSESTHVARERVERIRWYIVTGSRFAINGEFIE